MQGQSIYDDYPELKAREIVRASDVSIPVVDFDGLKPLLTTTEEGLYVINFWATWCKPCVEELPGMLKVADDMKGRNVKFLFVSLDFRKNLESGLIPFVKERGMQDRVILLQDPDADRWIGQVSGQWSGAIPATLFFNKDKREFHEKMLHEQELKTIIQSIIN